MTQAQVPQKDWWDKADVAGKWVVALAISGAIAFYGTYVEDKRESAQFEIAEKRQRHETFLRMITSREASEADMSAKLFTTLMSYYQKNDDKANQFLFLKLIGLNFQDQIHIKPLFEHFDSGLHEGSEEKLRNDLRNTAKDIIGREIKSILNAGGIIREIKLLINQETNIPCIEPLKLRMVDVQESRINISTSEEDNHGFEVSYFDMPFVDNSTLGETTYSVVLSNIDVREKSALVKVVLFPKYYYGIKNRLRIDREIGKHLLDNEKSEVEQNSAGKAPNRNSQPQAGQESSAARVSAK